MHTDVNIQNLKSIIYTNYGIILKEDDPAWLMILIYNDLLGNVNKSISDLQNIPKISTQNEEILKALNAVQIQVNETIDKSNNLVNNLEAKNTVLLDATQGEIIKLKKTIDTTIQEAINNVKIDTTELSKIIDKKIKDFDINKINNLITITNNKTDAIVQTLANKALKIEIVDNLVESSIEMLNRHSVILKQKTDAINSTIENISKISQKVSNFKLFLVLLVGLIGGFTVATYFKIDALSDYYFNVYDKKQNKLETVLRSSDFLVRELVKGDYKTELGFFTDTQQKFLSVKKGSFIEKPYISKDGDAVIILR